MIKIFLDTNIWIYLAKNSYPKLWPTIKGMKDYCFIVNDIIKKEWSRNKKKTIKDIETSIKQEYQSALKLKSFIPVEEFDIYSKILNKYKDEDERIKAAESIVEEVETIINSSECIPVTEEQKLFVANLAIEKKEPFGGNKSNFNDALIARSIIEYCQGQGYPLKYDVIFVTKNAKDFFDEEGKLFPDLIKGCNEVRILNVKELGQALKRKNDLDKELDIWYDNYILQELENRALFEAEL